MILEFLQRLDWRGILPALAFGLAYELTLKWLLGLMAALPMPGWHAELFTAPQTALAVWQVLLLGSAPLTPGVLLGWAVAYFCGPALRYTLIALAPYLLNLVWSFLEAAELGVAILAAPWLLTVPIVALATPPLAARAWGADRQPESFNAAASSARQ